MFASRVPRSFFFFLFNKQRASYNYDDLLRAGQVQTGADSPLDTDAHELVFAS